MTKFFIACFATLFCASPVAAQTWTSGSARPVIWTSTAQIGDKVDRVPEISTDEQGGDPPAWQHEPAAINDTNYNRSDWQVTVPDGTCVENGVNTKCRPHHGEDKFRLICSFSHMNRSDPILAPGNANGPHHHTFFGNEFTNQDTTYQTLRNNPKSSCGGGPMASSAYWEPTLMYEIKPGVYVPVISDGIAFYYTTNGETSPTLTRLPRGLSFIAGVDPGDRLATVRKAELDNAPPSGTGAAWDTRDGVEIRNQDGSYAGVIKFRPNGWLGWDCVRLGAGPQPVLEYSEKNDWGRQFVNNDGTDPWNGTCEGPNLQLIASMVAPECWDGYNLTSPNGRNHFRYPARKQDGSFSGCPAGWWRVPALVAKPEFPAFTHSIRKKMFLSSDRMSSNPAQWNPPGSTMHFDWINGWDYDIMKSWMMECAGVTINGVTREGGHGTQQLARTCDTQAFKDNTFLKSELISPNLALAPSPFGKVTNLSVAPKRKQFGKIMTGAQINDHIATSNKVDIHMTHPH